MRQSRRTVLGHCAAQQRPGSPIPVDGPAFHGVDVEPDKPKKMIPRHAGNKIPDLPIPVVERADSSFINNLGLRSELMEFRQHLAEYVSKRLAWRPVVAVDPDPVHISRARPPPSQPSPAAAVRIPAHSPDPDNIRRPLGSEHVMDVFPGGHEGSRPGVLSSPWVPRAIHFMAEADSHWCLEPPGSRRVTAQISIVLARGDVSQADMPRIYLYQGQRMLLCQCDGPGGWELPPEAHVVLHYTGLLAQDLLESVKPRRERRVNRHTDVVARSQLNLSLTTNDRSLVIHDQT